MQQDGATTWIDANQRYLVAALADVRASLEQYIARQEGKAMPAAESRPPAPMQDTAPFALEVLCGLFALSSFERSVILLCAGVELDASFTGLCGAAQRDATRSNPTFSLALAALPDPHWSALTPAGPLRHWRLIEIGQQPAMLLTTSRLKIDERILHFLTGFQHMDDRLVGLVEPVTEAVSLVPSHQTLAQQAAAAWNQAQGRLPLVELCGADESSCAASPPRSAPSSV